MCTGLSLELMQFANGKVADDLQICLYQLYLPATALCSRLYLKNKLTCWHWCGALLVFAGCVIVGGIGLFTSGDAASSGSGAALTAAAGPSAGQAALWAIVYAIGTIPLGFACVLQEQVFEECPTVSVLQMSFWVHPAPSPLTLPPLVGVSAER